MFHGIAIVSVFTAIAAGLMPEKATANSYRAAGAFMHQRWSDRSNYAATGAYNSSAWRTHVDSAGGIWIFGEIIRNNQRFTAMRKSSDSGATWVTKADIQARIFDVALDNANRIYLLAVIGGDFVIKRTSDEGITWNDIIPYQENWDALAVSPDGNTIFLAGTDSDGKWVLAKSGDGGTTWSTLDRFELFAGRGMDSVSKIAVNSATNDVWMVGTGYKSNWETGYVVRKSSDGGITWSTKDSVLDGAESYARDISWDESGKVYVVGLHAVTWDDQHWIVRMSADNGNTWATVDDYLPPTNFGEAQTIARAANGDLYVAGSFDVAGPGSEWAVRKSSDGVTWATVDAYQYSAGQPHSVDDLVVTPSGEVYAVGRGRGANGLDRWIVRKSADQGASWSTQDDYSPTGPVHTAFTLCSINSAGTLFVAAEADNFFGQLLKSDDGGLTWSGILDPGVTDNRMKYHDLEIHPISGALYATVGGASGITLRKSSDQGATWNTVATFADQSYDSNLAFDPSGNLFLATTSSDSGHWLVRKSTDDGLTWTPLDDFPGFRSTPLYLVVGTSGIFAAGFNMSANDQPERWIVRKSADGGATWATVDNYLYAAGKNSYATGISVSPAGTLWIRGVGTDSSGKPHSIVRKSANGGSSWTIVDHVYAAGISFYPTASLFDRLGNMVVAGRSSSSVYIRSSADGGTSWRNTRGPVTETGSFESLCTSSSSTAVYAVGSVTKSGAPMKGTVSRYR